MKFKDENGTEIDCSVEEYLALLKLSKEKKAEKHEKHSFVWVSNKNAENASQKRWTMEEEKILRKNIHLPMKELMSLLSSKTRDAISSKINALGLIEVRRQTKTGFTPSQRGKGRFTWTQDELRILREHAFEDYKEIHKLIPNKTITAIRCRISNLKLRKNLPRPINNSMRAGGYTTWSKQEEQFLRENIGSCRNSKQLTKKFNKVFSKRNWNGVYQHVRIMGLSFKGDSLYGKKALKLRRENNGLKSYSPVRIAKAKDRLKVIHENARRYVNSYGWSYEKAKAQAIQDWSNHAGLSKHKNSFVVEHRPVVPVKPVEMKYWFPITDENHDIFESVVKNLINVSPHKLELTDINWLRLKNGYNWSFESWNDFLSWFIYNSDDICKYLKVSNKFKIENERLIYEE